MTLRRQQLIEFIGVKLAHLKACVETLNKVHFFDLNVAAEDFFARLLNEIYGWSLQNLNHTDLNKAAVDLGDSTDPNKRIAVQVTSERSATKIKKTLKKFEDHGLGTDYELLKVLIIGDRTGNYQTVSVPAGVSFSPANDVIDIDGLMKSIKAMSLTQIEGIADLISKEVREHPAVLAMQKQSDEDALKEYRSKFSRPAFQDNWNVEDNFQGFRNALTDLIELLNNGTIDGGPVAKKRDDFVNIEWQDDLETVYDKLLALRALFTTHVRSGEIVLKHNACQFHNPDMIDVFNVYKQSIVDEINSLFRKAHIKEIKGIRAPHSSP